MKLLVTGGAGYIGSVVAAQLVAAGHEVVVLDDVSTGHVDAVPDGATFVAGTVAQADAVLDGSYDAVVHFAAKAVVSESVDDPELYWRTNLGATLHLLDAMRSVGVGRLVVSSTASVYGAPAASPITETTPTIPINPYGQSKLAMDHAVGQAARADGLGAVSLRYFNVAGASGRQGERHDPETHLIPTLLAVAAGQRRNAEIYGTDYPTRDGTAVRDYLHVEDLARAHLLALAAVRPGEHRIYNLGTESGSTVREIVAVCREVTGCPLPAIERERRPGDPPSLVASARRARSELGWAPRHDLTRIVADAWAFLTGRSQPPVGAAAAS